MNYHKKTQHITAVLHYAGKGNLIEQLEVNKHLEVGLRIVLLFPHNAKPFSLCEILKYENNNFSYSCINIIYFKA